MTKRILAAFTAIVMTLTLALPALAAGVSQSEPATRSVVSGQCGDALTWELDTDTGVMTISGTGEMYDYPEFSQYSDAASSVVIEEGCTSIGANAFYDFESLASVSLPESLTGIGSYAFIFCYSLASAEFPEGLESIGEGAFEWCTALESITIPSSVTSIGDWAFSSCNMLNSVVTLDNF